MLDDKSAGYFVVAIYLKRVEVHTCIKAGGVHFYETAFGTKVKFFNNTAKHIANNYFSRVSRAKTIAQMNDIYRRIGVKKANPYPVIVYHLFVSLLNRRRGGKRGKLKKSQ